MRLVCFSLFVFIHSVICTNESGVQSDVQRRSSVNHPPLAEDYNPIPVSVVNKDDVIDMKPRIPKYHNISHGRKVDQKVSTAEGGQLSAPKEIQEIEPTFKNKTQSKTEDKLVRPTVRTLGELHIPVAVIYDSPPENTQNSRAVEQEYTNIGRRKYKRVSRRKPLQNTIENENLTNQSTTEPVIGVEVSNKPEIQRTKPIKPQLSRTESAKPHIENDESVKSENPKMKPVLPQMSRIESAKPQVENNDSAHSGTSKMKPVKPQLSRIESANPRLEREDLVKSDIRSTKTVNAQLSRSESVKPRRIASTIQSPSNIETITEGQKTKRVRDPVVPIVEMENYVYAHSGNFHYSYEGGDGTKAHSEGQLRSINEVAGEAVSGGFSYTDKDGNDFSLSYTADEHGYRPIGAHLPTPPPIPPAIARALAYLATATTPEPVTKPSIKQTGK